jgi:uncharacterized protein
MTSDFQCAGCGECCRIAGQVRLTEGDTQRLAGFLDLTEHDFIQRYTEIARNRRGLVIRGDPALPCLFLNDSRCTIYAARPEQCASYPVQWRNQGRDRLCKSLAD